jgi:hypothetical protein
MIAIKNDFAIDRSLINNHLVLYGKL